jgi:gluconokinase
VIGNGGALEASPAWAQIIVNALNRPLYLLAEQEITGRGVAILVLRALYQRELKDFAPALSRYIVPQAAQASRLRAARLRQQHLYQQLIFL